jgi:hypothetical protein
MNEIEKEFVPYTEALALKELGFDEPFNPFDTFYYRNGYLCEANKNAVESFNSFNDEVVLAPLYQQSFKFFREKYNLLYSITEYNKDVSLIIKITQNKVEVFREMTNFDISEYEQAEFECLKKLIELANEKKIHR